MTDEEGKKSRLLIDSPKSRSSYRDIPIPNFLLKEISKFWVDNEKANFLTGHENEFLEPRTYQNHFKSYLSVCNIQNANFHCLRHTFATRCIEAGFDVKSLSEILGHSDVNITLNRYVHSSFEQKIKNMTKLEKLFNE